MKITDLRLTFNSLKIVCTKQGDPSMMLSATGTKKYIESCVHAIVDEVKCEIAL